MKTRSGSPGLTNPIITPEFQHCLNEVERGANLFVTGKAGTGKSTLLRLIEARMRDKNVTVVAPTGVAALNVDGATIHRLFGFRAGLTPDLRKYRAPDHLSDVDLLIIDEVSMVSAELMDMVSKALQFARGCWNPFGGAQVVMIGDLYQLPPISNEGPRESYYATDFFFSSKAYLESQPLTLELTKVFRQKDPVFIDILNAIRDGSATAAHLQHLNARYDPTHTPGMNVRALNDPSRSITIATRNKDVDQINNDHLSQITDKETTYTARRYGDVHEGKFDGLDTLRLKCGAQVMMLVNQDGYANGTIGVVRCLAESEVQVYIPDLDEVKTISRHKWEVFRSVRKDGRVQKEVVGSFEQFPMQLAWAVTVHKSQGKTFDKVVFHCKSIFEDGQTYVALSRCTSLDGLTLTQPIEPRHVKISTAVQRFFRATRKVRRQVTAGPIAFVGLHTTGSDKYRKLVEVGMIRFEGGRESFRFSTLIAPGRDASDAAEVGINASHLTLCPSIEQARDIIGLALDGAVIVGRRVHDLLALSDWPQDVADEGSPFEIGDTTTGEGTSASALELAETAARFFNGLQPIHRDRLNAAPFEFLATAIRPGSYLFSRSSVEGVASILSGEAFRGLEEESKADTRVGVAVALIAEGSATSVANAKRLLDTDGNWAPRLEAMRDMLLRKAETDKQISKEEADVVNRFSSELCDSLAVVEVADSRPKTAFRKGMKVYLSGGPGKAGSQCEGMSKNDIFNRCDNSGIVFLPNFRKKDSPDALVVADLSTEGGNRRKADRWGIPVMSWEELLEWALDRR